MPNPFHKLLSPKELAFKQILAATKKGGFPNFQQWKQLPRILSAGEKKILGLAAFVAFAALASLSIWYISTHRIDIPTLGGEYTEALIGEPQFINPLYASNSDVDADLTRLVYSGLMRFDPSNGLVKDLASDIQISEDGKTYTIKLRDNALFGNGEAVRARDIIFTVDAIQNPAYRSPLAVSFKGVSVSQVDDITVAFTLEEPFAPFLSTLTVGILPANIWGEIEPRNAPLASRNLEPVGSGPYRFLEFSKDKSGNILSYTLESNPFFYQTPALLEKLTFKFYPNAQEAVRALENRNVEGVSFVPEDLVEQVEGVHGITIVRPTIPREVALYFNQTASETLKDKVLRTAIAQAINKQVFVDDVLGGHGHVIDTPILSGMMGEYEGVAKLAFDVVAANNALTTAGYTWAEGATTRQVKSATKPVEGITPAELTFTLTTVQNPEFVQTAELIASQLALIGIKLQVNPVSSEDFFGTVIQPKNYEILLTGTLLGIDPDPYPFWHSSQNKPGGLNLALFANRNADTLLEDARKTTNVDDRAAKYREFQDMIAADVPAVFLYQSTYTYAISDKVKNVSIERVISPADRFAKINEWYIKTKKALR